MGSEYRREEILEIARNLWEISSRKWMIIIWHSLHMWWNSVELLIWCTVWTQDRPKNFKFMTRSKLRTLLPRHICSISLMRRNVQGFIYSPDQPNIQLLDIQSLACHEISFWLRTTNVGLLLMYEWFVALLPFFKIKEIVRMFCIVLYTWFTLFKKLEKEGEKRV